MSQGIRYWILAAWLLVASSCGDKPATVQGLSTAANAEEGIPVNIDVAAGTSWADEGKYIPVPANVGMVNDHHVLVLSDAVAVGMTLDVLPLAAAKIQEAGELHYYIVGIPADVSQRTNGINDFSDFTTKYSSAKWIIEQYIVSRNGLGKATLVGWEDEAYVKNNLLSVDK